jgi:hypothetical protein
VQLLQFAVQPVADLREAAADVILVEEITRLGEL